MLNNNNNNNIEFINFGLKNSTTTTTTVITTTTSTNFTNTLICESQENVVNMQSNLEYETIINGAQGYVLWGIVFVLIAFLGCIGNIVTIIVLKRDPIMTTLNILLIALAISDILAPLANALIALTFYHMSNRYGDSVEFLVVSDILRHIIQPLSTMFTMSSSWIVTTTTLFRLIAVLWPFKARTLINRRFAVLSLFIIFGMSLAAIMPLYASLIRKVKCTRDMKHQYLAFDMEVTSELMAKAYMPMIQVMSFYLPWLIALTLWIFLLRSLRRSERNFNVTFIAKDSPSTNTLALSPYLQQQQSRDPNSTTTVGGGGGTLNNTNNNNNNSLNHHHNHYQSSNHHNPVNRRTSGGFFSKRPSNIEVFCETHGSTKSSNGGGTLSSSHILHNNDSRINNAQTRLRSYNRITLMVVVLCFTNLICRVFTFVFIFEVIFNEYLKRTYMYLLFPPQSNLTSSNYIDDYSASSGVIYPYRNGSQDDYFSTSTWTPSVNMSFFNARTHYPKFLAYSLLLNNIFLCVNHSCNILIYTLTNPRFKKNLISLLNSCALWFCHHVLKKKHITTVFGAGNGPNAAATPPVPLTPATPGSGSTKIILPVSANRHSMQGSLKTTTTLSGSRNERTRKKRKKLVDDDVTSAGGGGGGGGGVGFLGAKRWPNATRGADDKCLHYLLCFFCRFNKSPNGVTTVASGDNQVTTALVSEQADIGCNRQSSNESKSIQNNSSDESKKTKFNTNRNGSSYKKVHHSNNISFRTV